MPAARGPVWPTAIFGVYIAGFLFLIARMAAGWRSARRLCQAAEPVPGLLAWESAEIAAPLIARHPASAHSLAARVERVARYDPSRRARPRDTPTCAAATR